MGHLAVSADLMISVEKNSGVNSLVIKHITEMMLVIMFARLVIFKYWRIFIWLINLSIFQHSILNDILSVQHTLDVLGMYHCLLP